jgi:hypothetical protein
MFIAKLAAGRVVHGPHHRKPVRPLRQSWQILAKASARQPRLHRPVGAADVVGSIGFGVERLMLGRATGLENEYDGLGPAGSSRWLADGVGLQAQPIGQAGSEQRQRS